LLRCRQPLAPRPGPLAGTEREAGRSPVAVLSPMVVFGSIDFHLLLSELDFRDFERNKVNQEKPEGCNGQEIHDAIGASDDKSLFGWIVANYSQGWLRDGRLLAHFTLGHADHFSRKSRKERYIRPSGSPHRRMRSSRQCGPARGAGAARVRPGDESQFPQDGRDPARRRGVDRAGDRTSSATSR
jgi:hypothetical protein